jgi:diadenosine tetraphosphate (Ap4A) HIT family hydrolase
MLNRHEEDLWNITPEEREELWMIGGKLEKVILNLFHPDHFNYTRLGHQIRHLNLHVIPRYQDPRTFMGEEFLDDRWGQSFATAAERSLPDEIVRAMIGSIKEELEKE